MEVEVDESQFEEEDQEDHPAEDQGEDMKRRSRNVNKPLDQREGGLEEKIDSELTPGRQGGKGSKGGKDKGDEKGKGKGRGRGSSGSNEARSKWGGNGSGIDTGARSSNQTTTTKN